MEEKKKQIVEEVDEPDFFETPEDFEKSVEESVSQKAQEQTAAFSRNENTKEKYSHKAANKPKRRKRTIIVSIVGAFVLALIGVGAVFANTILNSSFEDEENLDLHASLKTTEYDEPFYMVLVGTDTREEDGSYQLTDGRSDSCILVRIDPVNYLVTMISIPRDTMIKYNGSTEKFNAAYNLGGIKDTIGVINKMFNIEVSHYAEVSFNGLTDMVDAVGGVEVDVPTAINDSNVDSHIPAGLQTLNGIQALSFARSRQYGDGDFTRSANQRVLISALIQKAFKLPIGDLPNVLQTAKKFVKTDLKIKDMYTLATQFRDADKITLYSAMVPSTTGSVGGASYVFTDKECLKRMMMMVENGEDPLMVEVTSGASVSASRDAKDLEAKRTQYYIDHPDSPGKATSSSTTYATQEPAVVYYSSNYKYSDSSDSYDSSGSSSSSSSSNSSSQSRSSNSSNSSSSSSSSGGSSSGGSGSGGSSSRY